jgi:hypothetical protein
MKNQLYIVRKSALKCVWTPTGEAKRPLACVWVETGAQCAASSESADSEAGGLRLCA